MVDSFGLALTHHFGTVLSLDINLLVSLILKEFEAFQNYLSQVQDYFHSYAD